MNYSYTKKIEMSFEETLDEVRFVFIEKWFWVVSNINIAEKIQDKVDSSFQNYTVLWFCNPELAYKYLSYNKDLWVFLPCSVVIYEKNDGVYISAGLPDAILPSSINDEILNELSKTLSSEIKLIIDSI